MNKKQENADKNNNEFILLEKFNLLELFRIIKKINIDACIDNVKAEIDKIMLERSKQSEDTDDAE